MKMQPTWKDVTKSAGFLIIFAQYIAHIPAKDEWKPKQQAMVESMRQYEMNNFCAQELGGRESAGSSSESRSTSYRTQKMQRMQRVAAQQDRHTGGKGGGSCHKGMLVACQWHVNGIPPARQQPLLQPRCSYINVLLISVSNRPKPRAGSSGFLNRLIVNVEIHTAKVIEI
ncbi:hypothetical protein C8R44DRAFT_746923 [Mycena epipterygia]|nr:hypothetical protein C8R44DRAFT_746923 [Mycena epipterygia]